jgi:predicted MFS family arabinose efflux permease
VARVTVAFGWKNAFLALAGAAFLTALVALLLLTHQRLQKPRNTEA